MLPFKPTKQLNCPETGAEFAFPFPPYDIQLDLMKRLYTVLGNGGIGIFESPTGTGKSLSLTCGSLSWLKDYERAVDEELCTKIDALRKDIATLEKENEVSSDWITGQYNVMGWRKELDELQDFRTAVEEHRKRLVAMKDKAVLLKKHWITAKDAANDGVLRQDIAHQDVILDEDEFLLADDSGGSGDEELESNRHEVDAERYRPVQMIFCSRTHSQLSQVVGEVKGTQHAADLRLMSLASRQSLCINPEVRKLKSNTLINERCLELLKKGGKGRSDSKEAGGSKKRRKVAQSCPFYNQRAIEGLKNGTLFEVPDIEDLVKAGKREKACPYYASRAAIPDAQVLMVPYQLILHRRTRQQSGIDLRDSVLIIDEAHNLLDTIAAIHSQELSQGQLQQAKMHLAAYKARYFARFTSKNLLRINQLLFVATRLEKLLSCDSKSTEAGQATTATGSARSSRMIATHDLLLDSDIFNLDLVDILSFCERSRLAQKVHGYAQSASPAQLLAQASGPLSGRPKVGGSSKAITSGLKSLLKTLEEEKERKMASKQKGRQGKPASDRVAEVAASEQENGPISAPQPPTGNAVRPLISFLECFIEDAGGDGRVLLTFDPKDPSRSCMKYLLLNPGTRFEEIVQSCRSLVLAGGTMQPTEELTEQIFRNCPERVTIKSYPHVVPPDAVRPIALARGPTGKEFLFNYANRQCPQLLDELQSTLINLCSIVPNGVVVFFSSYEYLDQFWKRLEASGNRARLEARKRMFREPRSTGQVERTLAEYGVAAKSATGALLFSVVGGKLSEGLNFSDELGRCVVVVGMPYPNRTSPELAERMRYLDRTLTQGPSSAGSEYYENLCMKAVNQCIGRAVRHIRDYAAVVLLDARYCTGGRIRRKLAMWITERMVYTDRYGLAHGSLVKFFRDHKPNLTRVAATSEKGKGNFGEEADGNKKDRT